MQITYSKRHTMNLGNYENMTVEIGVQDEVNFEEGETLEEGYLRLRKWVNIKLKQEVDKIKGN